METFIYPSYQDFTSVSDLPSPPPISPFYPSWTIPLTFNFSFPEMELPSPYLGPSICDTETSTVPALEICTGADASLPLQPSQSTLPDTTYYPSPPVSPTNSTYPTPNISTYPIPDNTPPSSPTGVSDNAAIAQSLYKQGEFDELISYISTTYFPSSDHSLLQTLYYNSLYELHKISTGKRRLIPTQKYRLRKSHPLPSTISSVKFRSNNHFDDNVRSLLLAVFKKERIPSAETIQNLSDNTGLTEKQIRNFFKNKRSRG